MLLGACGGGSDGPSGVDGEDGRTTITLTAYATARFDAEQLGEVDQALVQDGDGAWVAMTESGGTYTARVRGPASVSSGAPEHTRRRSSFGPLSAAASCRPSPYFSEVVEMGDGTLTGHLSGGTSSGGAHVGQAGASVTSRPSTKRATSRSGDAALELS